MTLREQHRDRAGWSARSNSRPTHQSTYRRCVGHERARQFRPQRWDPCEGVEDTLDQFRPAEAARSGEGEGRDKPRWQRDRDEGERQAGRRRGRHPGAAATRGRWTCDPRAECAGHPVRQHRDRERPWRTARFRGSPRRSSSRVDGQILVRGGLRSCEASHSERIKPGGRGAEGKNRDDQPSRRDLSRPHVFFLRAAYSVAPIK